MDGSILSKRRFSSWLQKAIETLSPFPVTPGLAGAKGSVTRLVKSVLQSRHDGKRPNSPRGRQVSVLKRQTEGTASRPINNVIGKRVRHARLSQELTPQALYQRIQVQSGFELGQPTLTRIELGTRSVYEWLRGGCPLLQRDQVE